MPGRVLALALLFTFELIAFSIRFDTADLPRLGLAGLVEHWAPGVLRAAVAFAALFLTFGWIARGSAFQLISAELTRRPVSWKLLGAHAGAMLAFATLSHLLFAGNARWNGNLAVALWLASGCCAAGFAAAAFIQPVLGLRLLRKTGGLAAIAAVGGLTAWLAGDAGALLWQSATDATFRMVYAILRPFLPDVFMDPAGMAVGTHKFYVIIAPECSGLQGAGLMLVYGALWVWFFRRECRMPRALLMIPAGVLLVWLLNAARIAGLILIGNAGAPGIATGGFHSQAGWIGFNAAALGFSYALSRSRWLTRQPAQPRPAAENPTAWYLIPFLVILAAALVSRAVSDGFEALYSLRLLAAAALVQFRGRYKDLDWRVGWAAPAAGVSAFAIWVGLSGAAGVESGSAGVLWTTLRIAAAVVTVPIAEELAFRGFLLRRLMRRDFEKVDARKAAPGPVLVSSIAFGVLHGEQWLAAIVAGVLYAWAYRHRGRIGDAVAAHAITNALLAGYMMTG